MDLNSESSFLWLLNICKIFRDVVFVLLSTIYSSIWIVILNFILLQRAEDCRNALSWFYWNEICAAICIFASTHPWQRSFISFLQHYCVCILFYPTNGWLNIKECLWERFILSCVLLCSQTSCCFSIANLYESVLIRNKIVEC